MVTTPAHEPTAQSLVFGHLPITFDDRVLRPRPWTVAQSRWAAELLIERPGPASILELCAGAGHIGLLTLALARSSQDRLVAVDVNPVACELVRRNAVEAGHETQVDVREGRADLVLAPDETFDLVIADPPWVPREETTRFPEDPPIAIDGGPDGLDVAWSCIRVCEQHLVDDGAAIVQLGTIDQAHQVRETLHAEGSPLMVREVRPFGSQGVLILLVSGAA
jgi:methylase of polypeptide subunit release factors